MTNDVPDDLYYQILGVDQDAPQSTIREQGRELIKDTHPDHGGSADEFKRVKAAYDVLTDEDKRSSYDAMGHKKYVQLHQSPGANTRQTRSTTNTTTSTSSSRSDASSTNDEQWWDTQSNQQHQQQRTSTTQTETEDETETGTGEAIFQSVFTSESPYYPDWSITSILEAELRAAGRDFVTGIGLLFAPIILLLIFVILMIPIHLATVPVELVIRVLAWLGRQGGVTSATPFTTHNLSTYALEIMIVLFIGYVAVSSLSLIMDTPRPKHIHELTPLPTLTLAIPLTVFTTIFMTGETISLIEQPIDPVNAVTGWGIPLTLIIASVWVLHRATRVSLESQSFRNLHPDNLPGGDTVFVVTYISEYVRTSLAKLLYIFGIGLFLAVGMYLAAGWIVMFIVPGATWEPLINEPTAFTPELPVITNTLPYVAAGSAGLAIGYRAVYFIAAKTTTFEKP